MRAASFVQGTIATLAGTGDAGYRGDGGPASHAELNEPKSVCVGPDETLYVADSENHLIRRIALASGVITTVAGRPDHGSAPPAAPMHQVSQPETDEDPFDPQPMGGNYVNVSDLSGTVRFVVGAAGTRWGGDNGPATEAMLNFPSAIVVAGDGTLYIADTMNHRIRKVDPVSGRISTIAGTGQRRCSGDGGPATAATLNEPTALALGDGRLYVADQSNNRVRCIALSTGIITTVAGTGEAEYNGDDIPAIDASIAGPSGLALSATGELFIADTFNGRIRAVNLASGLIRTVVGDGGAFRYQGPADDASRSLSRPYGIALDGDGHILITDSDSHLIRRWHMPSCTMTRVAGSGMAGFAGDGGTAAASTLSYPFGVAVDQPGRIYIADTFNHRIRMIAP